MDLRIGLSQRVVEVADYGETRDAIDQAWYRFLDVALPGTIVVPIPNIGDGAVGFAKSLGLGGFVFTGGNDLGECIQRDETEIALLNHAHECGMPVVGVCRGFQMMNVHNGGSIAPCSARQHVATRHEVSFSSDTTWGWRANEAATVNSFHNFTIRSAGIAPDWIRLAQTSDGDVEAARDQEGRQVGIMWHPERQHPNAETDINLMRVCLAGSNHD
ncbi:gamma-glutamyl-gamma-aminobutyrate hydrolase family protein [Alphaproteobacteria bacterium]|nr:gamma-glutamyl-gamma-aminobutyrate hydrolase family protein [Alphaproteobacteria bacterium]